MRPNQTNYHSHCSFCDGRASMEEFVKTAIQEGFNSYGISSHAPLPFSTRWTMDYPDMENYLAEFHHLRDKYKSNIELYVGLEIDYLNEESHPGNSYFTALPLDYRIGSVHMLYSPEGEVVDIDCRPEIFRQRIDTYFNGDIRKVVELYYQRLQRMIELGGFDMVGHADKIHYNANSYLPGILDSSWYSSLMESYFEAIAEKGYMVEVNTKAWNTLGTFFPNARYFPFLKELGIQVVVNSDAHYLDLLNAGRPQALAALKKAGFYNVMEIHRNQWEEVPIYGYAF